MTDTTHPVDNATTARTHAADSWNLFTAQKGYKATVPAWQTSTSPDGSVLLSGQVVGAGAEYALARFARDHYLVLGQYGDQRPQFDVTQPGRTVLVWRYGGVWVELWHPDTAVDAPQAAGPVVGGPAPSEDAPASAAPAPATATGARTERRRLLGPGGRLFFTRKSRTLTPKETTTR